MKNTLYTIFFFIGISLISCSKDASTIEPIVEGTDITQFSFLKANNPNLLYDINLEISGQSIKGRIPFNVAVTNLIATFENSGSSAVINDVNQVSGSTSNNFTNLVTYTVKTTDGREAAYEVDVTKFTGLPIIYINTNGVEINSKDIEIPGTLTIDGGRNYSMLNNTTMAIRGRGNSTWWLHPKKPYQLKFESKNEMLGMPKDKKWIFLAEYSDKTMLRNVAAFEMGYLSKLEFTPKSAFAEVYLNNQYNGTYSISQKVEAGSNRVVLGSTGYLLEIDQLDRLDPGDVYFRTNDFLINIKEPELTIDSNEYNYVKNLLNEFENVLKSDQFKDPNIGYAKYIDVDSFIDWYLINEIAKNQDSKDFSSIFLNVMPGGKIKMGPIWDFDLAFGNVNYSDATNPTGFWVKDHKWYARLFQDPLFVAKVKLRFIYFKDRQNLIIDKIDTYANYLKWAQEENDKKWNTIGVYVWPNHLVLGTYEAEVNQLKTWYSQRMNWLGTAFNNL
ncbi:MAG: CotH kinase family protein [Lutibacter sp.]